MSCIGESSRSFVSATARANAMASPSSAAFSGLRRAGVGARLVGRAEGALARVVDLAGRTLLARLERFARRALAGFARAGLGGLGRRGGGGRGRHGACRLVAELEDARGQPLDALEQGAGDGEAVEEAADRGEPAEDRALQRLQGAAEHREQLTAEVEEPQQEDQQLPEARLDGLERRVPARGQVDD